MRMSARTVVVVAATAAAVVVAGPGCVDPERPCTEDAQCDDGYFCDLPVVDDIDDFDDEDDVGTCREGEGPAGEGEGEGEGEEGEGEGEGEPEPIAAKRVEIGGAFACAIDADDFVQCWGGNSRGQLGRVTDRQRDDVPARIPGLSDVTDLALGEFHGCALGRLNESQAQVFCWGDPAALAAPDGVDVDVGVLVAPRLPAGFGVDVDDLASAPNDANASSATCAVDTGTAKTICFGDNAPGAFGADVIEVAALSAAVSLDAHTQGFCGRDANNDVVCVDVGAGLALLGCTNAVPCAALANNVAYSVTTDAACVIVAGVAQCAGENEYGVVDPTARARGPLPLTATIAAVDVEVGTQHACAVSGTSLQCWGRPLFSATGLREADAPAFCGAPGDGAPRCQGFLAVALPAGVTGVVDVAGNSTSHCALAVDGRVVCWGGIDEASQALPVVVPLFGG